MGGVRELLDIDWNGDLWVLTGYARDSGTIWSSSDGKNWTERYSSGNRVNQVVWNGGQFVAVGNSGTVLTSPDGAAWSRGTIPSTVHLNTVAWNGAGFLADSKQQKQTWLSSDGKSWTMSPANPGIFRPRFAGALGRFVGIGDAGRIVTSPDGTAWTSRSSGTIADLTDITWTGRRLVTVADSGIILTSDDGETWTRRSSGLALNSHLEGVSFQNEMNGYAVGLPGVITGTTDGGLTWNVSISGIEPYKHLQAIAYGDRRWIAVGHGPLADMAAIVTLPDASGNTSVFRPGFRSSPRSINSGRRGLTAPDPLLGFSQWLMPAYTLNGERIQSVRSSGFYLLDLGSGSRTRARIADKAK